MNFLESLKNFKNEKKSKRYKVYFSDVSMDILYISGKIWHFRFSNKFIVSVNFV